jgi:hypothetical protein
MSPWLYAMWVQSSRPLAVDFLSTVDLANIWFGIWGKKTYFYTAHSKLYKVNSAPQWHEIRQPGWLNATLSIFYFWALFPELTEIAQPLFTGENWWMKKNTKIHGLGRIQGWTTWLCLLKALYVLMPQPLILIKINFT